MFVDRVVVCRSALSRSQERRARVPFGVVLARRLLAGVVLLGLLGCDVGPTGLGDNCGFMGGSCGGGSYVPDQQTSDTLFVVGIPRSAYRPGVGFNPASAHLTVGDSILLWQVVTSPQPSSAPVWFPNAIRDTVMAPRWGMEPSGTQSLARLAPVRGGGVWMHVLRPGVAQVKISGSYRPTYSCATECLVVESLVFEAAPTSGP